MSQVTIPGENGEPALEGIWLGAGERTAIVAPPHPLMGGELSNPVVQALAMGLGAAGSRSLLFNWRGTGESGGDASGDPDQAERDYLTALGLAARAGAEVIAAGYSFGAAAALRIGARDARVRYVVAVAPPPFMLEGYPVERLGGACTIIAGERDAVARATELSSWAERAGARLEVLPDADHFFGQALGRISEIARDALSTGNVAVPSRLD
jgi:alpha/beta superfamily hydrolase